jgi:hypothetical protein
LIVAVAVSGVADAETTESVNKKIIAIVKPPGREWRVSFSSIEDKTIFRVRPASDPKELAGIIDFGKVTHIERLPLDLKAGS